ncbi:MAG TPA: hypothetical protein ENK18_14930 [Deltaproteobacteria bacterium]|nr:hypothetical protein [Deltaproteobacteria bacterium]
MTTDRGVICAVVGLALIGCRPDVTLTGSSSTQAEAVDHTIEWTTDRPGAVAFLSPIYTVPPYTDQTMCYFDTYDGEEAAVFWAGFYQNLDFGHHVVLMSSEADEDDWPDGTIADCTETSAEIMVDARPFLFASDLTGALQPEMNLPEGMAVKLKEGTRFVIQSHHINTTGDPILVNDAVFLETRDVSEVETFAAPWVHTETDLEIPPGESLSLEVDCAFDEDVTLLSLLGHLHEWGTSYAVDHHRADGSVERLYDIPEWDVQYRDAPPINTYEADPFPVAAGERFVTTCSWYNDTDEPLTFPYEMCATVGFAYPLTVPIICEPDL